MIRPSAVRPMARVTFPPNPLRSRSGHTRRPRSPPRLLPHTPCSPVRAKLAMAVMDSWAASATAKESASGADRLVGFRFRPVPAPQWCSGSGNTRRSAAPASAAISVRAITVGIRKGSRLTRGSCRFSGRQRLLNDVGVDQRHISDDNRVAEGVRRVAPQPEDASQHSHG